MRKKIYQPSSGKAIKAGSAFINLYKGILASHFRNFEPKFLAFPFLRGVRREILDVN